jgi:hypothetical protein
VRCEDRRILLAPGLRLEFRRAGEPWTHGLLVGGGAHQRFTLIAAAVEGDPACGDPARIVSPVYQDFQDHPVPEGEGVCALLTGQSTPHHFSAVVTARYEGPGAGAAVTFDVADRCRAPIAVLAATYLVSLDSGALIDAGPQRIVWGGEALGHGRLEFSTGGAGDLALAEAGRQATRVQAIARLVPTTHTQRLGYTWRWTPPS